MPVETPFLQSPALYTHQEYPKMMHHRNGAQRIVKNLREQRALEAAPGWGHEAFYPRYYVHLNGSQQIVKNLAEETALLESKDGKADLWMLHDCSFGVQPVAEEVDSLPGEATGMEVKRGPGRPRKVQE
ncbi:MAG TPA: hypothetical protein VHI13_08860 [Candidatus Kapabacteria bacterium]|nr:hypothetical protein [Candidatus Kapabacteria bacterium]